MKKNNLILVLSTLLIISSCNNEELKNSNNSISSSLVNDSSNSNNSSIESSSSLTDIESNNSTSEDLPNISSSSSNKTTTDIILKEQLDQHFLEQNYIPFLLDKNIEVPNYLDGFNKTIEWNINYNYDFLSITSTTNKTTFNIIKNDLSSGVVEISASIPELNYIYTYYSTINSNYLCKVPLIDIQTDDREMIPDYLDKEIYSMGYVSIIDYKNDNYMVDLSSKRMGVRMRGNSTTGAPKKAFRIKFDEKQSVLGMEKAKSWVLLANYFDKTNLRNYLAYTLANKMEGLGFQPSSHFVEVNFNNKYQGLYLLTEQMQTGKGRVDIEDQYDENNYPGYFLELDERLDDSGNELEDINYFKIKNVGGLSYNWLLEYKYPEPEDITTEQKNKIKEQFKKANQAIMSIVPEIENTEYLNHIDVASFVDYYLVQELFKNVDVASTSQYYVVEPGEKIMMGPVWDFDIALGVMGKDVYATYNSIDLFVRYRDPWYKRLFDDAGFLNKVKERYTEIRNTYIRETYYDIDTLVETYSEVLDKNEQCWPLIYKSYEEPYWIETYYHDDYEALETINAHYEYLKNQFNNRIRILDNVYL